MKTLRIAIFISFSFSQAAVTRTIIDSQNKPIENATISLKSPENVTQVLGYSNSYSGAPHNFYSYQGQIQWLPYDLNDCFRTNGHDRKTDMTTTSSERSLLKEKPFYTLFIPTAQGSLIPDFSSFGTNFDILKTRLSNRRATITQESIGH